MKTKEQKAAYMREWYQKNILHARFLSLESTKRYLKKTKNRTTKEWALRNKNKIQAEQILNRALNRGDIKKSVCRDCGNDKVHAHHFDYKKPLSVIWLCPPHHKAEHKKIYA